MRQPASVHVPKFRPSILLRHEASSELIPQLETSERQLWSWVLLTLAALKCCKFDIQVSLRYLWHQSTRFLRISPDACYLSWNRFLCQGKTHWSIWGCLSLAMMPRLHRRGRARMRIHTYAYWLILMYAEMQLYGLWLMAYFVQMHASNMHRNACIGKQVHTWHQTTHYLTSNCATS